MSPWLFIAILLLGCGDQGLTGNEAEVVTNVEVIVVWGASNAGGHNVDANGANSPPAGIPEPRVDFFRRGLVANEIVTDTLIQPLIVTAYGAPAGTSHGPELALGLRVLPYIGAHTRLAILKITANSTAITDWLEGGGAQNAALQSAVSAFKTQLALRYPGASSRWQGVVDIGGIEGGSGQPDNSAALAMPANFATFRGQFNSYAGATVTWHVFVEGSHISSQPWLSTERASEASMAAQTGGQAINIDSFDAYQSDGRHKTAACLNSGGTLAGDAALTVIRS